MARSRKRRETNLNLKADCGLDPGTSGFGGGRAIHWAMEAPLIGSITKEIFAKKKDRNSENILTFSTSEFLEHMCQK